jgi:hypothetical protein
MILLIVKIVLSLAGLSSAIFFWIIGLVNRSGSWVKTGWIVCLFTVGIVGAIAIIEYWLL